MPIVFQAKADVSDVEAKLRSLPAKAQAAGRATGDALGNGMRRGSSGSSGQYAAQMKARAAQAMRAVAPIENAAAAKKRARDAAENAKAQVALDAYNARRIKAEEKIASKREALAEKGTDEKGGKKSIPMISAAAGLYVFHSTMNKINDLVENAGARISAGGSGFSRQQSATVRSWQASAAGNISKQGSADLQDSMNESIQGEMDKLRTMSTDKNILEQVASFFDYRFDAERKSISEMNQDSQASRIHTMQLLARGSARQAQKGEALSGAMAKLTPNQQNFVLGNKLDELRDERSRLNLDDPKQLQKFQRLSAEIKGIETLRNPARENMQAQVQAATQMLGPTQKLAQLEKLRAGYVMESEKATTPLAERQKYEALATQTGIQVKQAEQDLKMRTLDVGLMGAGGRREAMRAMRREQRELNRAERIRKSGAQDARAFASDIIDPQRGREAELQRDGNVILGMMATDLRDINGKLAFPKLG